MIERLSNSPLIVPLEDLLQQSQQALTQEDWAWINSLWSGLLGEQPSETVLTGLQRRTLLNIGLSILAQGDFAARWDLGKWLPKLGADCIDPLLVLIADETVASEQRWFAVKMLGRFDSPEAIFGLTTLLNSSDDPDLTAIAAQSLTAFGAPALAALRDLLAREATRRLAVQALALIPDPAVIDSLLSVLPDPDPQIRAIAVAALGRFSEPRILPVVIHSLQDLAAVVRKEAVIAISSQIQFIQADDYLRYLQPLLRDIHLEICQQAAIALSRLQTPAAATVLFEALWSPLTPLPLKISLIQSLGWLAQPESLKFLEQALGLAEAEITREIVRVLGRVEEPPLKRQAVKVLVNCWESGHANLDNIPIRQALAHSLGQLQLPAALTVLQSLSEDRETSVKLHAIAALKKCQQRVSEGNNE